jgi:hypothetical protein
MVLFPGLLLRCCPVAYIDVVLYPVVLLGMGSKSYGLYMHHSSYSIPHIKKTVHNRITFRKIRIILK